MGDFAVKFCVKSKADGFDWALMAVYGTAQPELKPDFLVDLVRVCGNEQLPVLVRVISTLFEEGRTRIMRILTADGRLCSIPSLKAWILER